MSTFLLEIITPERVAYKENVSKLIVPSAMGQLTILANHTPLFSKLVEGELKIVKDEEGYYLAIGGGFMEVKPNRTIVLVTRAVHADEINEKEVRLAMEQAQEELRTKPKGQVFFEAKEIYRRSLLDLKVLKHRKHYTLKGPPYPDLTE